MTWVGGTLVVMRLDDKRSQNFNYKTDYIESSNINNIYVFENEERS